MSQETPGSSLIHRRLPIEFEGFESLADLALDVRWSWNHGGDEMWRQLHPELWDSTQNPWLVLQMSSRDHLQRHLSDPAFRKQLDDLLQAKKQAAEAPSWFGEAHAGAALGAVAYFSMEFMLSEALPIYSGGLGNVAGDQLKSASDLGVPLVGIGLLYQQGYFRQVIDKNGAQQALYPYNDPGQLPITPLWNADGEWLRIEIPMPGCSVWLRTWQVQVGRVKLYLLDSNDAANPPAQRAITSELYGGGPELRLQQEMVLGIGGWRMLQALGIHPDVCHLNEGHAAFAVLERARTFMQETGQPFAAALAATRTGNLFTTHTAVAAGFDLFPPALIEQYLGSYVAGLGLSLHDLLALGRRNPGDPAESFNMAYLAIRGSGAVNGVSRLHGKVSRSLFAPLFPRWPEVETPIGSVTNGVHMPTWDSADADRLWTESCGKERWRGGADTLEQDLRRVSDAEFWELRSKSRAALIEYTRKRLSKQLAASGASSAAIERARHVLSPNALTLGFARRFATYKRPDLLLFDTDRFIRLLANPDRPVQLIIAGKAHPADQPGQDLIRRWMRFLERPEVRDHAVFLSDYDMDLTGRLVQGADVWVNTPRRPWEACGTSGMKALVNGGINLSELDGWWAEAYTPQVGWAIGDGNEHGDDPYWDAADAESLYDRLEREVIPEFYTRDKNGVAVAWVTRIRESMAQLTPRFAATRAVRQYTEEHYLPAAAAYHERAANGGIIGQQIADWQRNTDSQWPSMRFGHVRTTPQGEWRLFEVELYLGDLDPRVVRVEIYADGVDDVDPFRLEMTRSRPLNGTPNAFLYTVSVPGSRSPSDYTARVIPYFEGAAVPLEYSRILWEH
ncbi:MAG TPA: alpha-glucan family phosphorylase [Armatimonadota bacterium]|nr:alpha-glucan family phosphorylase [Armatimonadota bacterium]